MERSNLPGVASRTHKENGMNLTTLFRIYGKGFAYIAPWMLDKPAGYKTRRGYHKAIMFDVNKENGK